MTKDQQVAAAKRRAKQRYNLVYRLREQGISINSIERHIADDSLQHPDITVQKRINTLRKLGYAIEHKLAL